MKKRANNGVWSCDLKGNMIFKSKLFTYDIDFCRLEDPFLIDHLMAKRWFIFGFFQPIFNQARENAGLNPYDYERMD